ncbi:monofunctional biosynthetic peptidoglycan transglycosylase [Pseudoruegeria sp. SHC-113]|uniref:monofunctional biosynthetic peptidoglycan transglycosylase n=1 Tax=Pseudoruegeria sp. SHC-113 TaxID=2855439 RepID=UPI0039647860
MGLLFVFLGRLFGRIFGFLFKWLARAVLAFYALVLIAVVFYAVVNPPTTATMVSEARRLGSIQKDWVGLEVISPHLSRAVVAAEDANFCRHWGFDVAAIREALQEGAQRGASTISQQVVKNVYLWQGRSWTRKALEGLITPVVELVWTKRRILEVYLNVAEFDEGVFGAEAGARRYFGKAAADLTAQQGALMATVLPNPKERSAAQPATWMQRRAAQIADGAATIAADGRADCFGG